MTLNDLIRLTRPLRASIANLVGRGKVRSTDDTKKVQELQVELLPGEVRDEVERFQEYGFTSKPMPPDDNGAAEVVLVFVNGRRDHALAIGTEDRRYRIRQMADGEVAVYDRTGSTILLKANGNIQISPSSGVVELAGDLQVSGDVSADGTVTATNDVVGGGKSLKTHTHSATLTLAGTTANPGAPLVGTATGSTGAPS